MAGTFILIAQQPLDLNGQHYEPGERFVAHWSESAGLIHKKLAIEAPSDEQRSHGAHKPLVDLTFSDPDARWPSELRAQAAMKTTHTNNPDAALLVAAFTDVEASAPRRRGRPSKVVEPVETEE